MKTIKGFVVIAFFILFFQVSMAETVVFQNGANGYEGCMDSWIIQNAITNNGDLTVI